MAVASLCALLLVAAAVVAAAADGGWARHRHPPLGLAAAARALGGGGAAASGAPAHPKADVASCEERWYEQTTDHFGWAAPAGGALASTFQQRYFLCAKAWKASPLPPAQRPVLFYFGNEDNVELYLNHTGLMWENADKLGAALLFVEHRYYGESLVHAAPGRNGTLPGNPACLNYCTTDQALADFASVLMDLEVVLDGTKRGTTPVIGFGGSYGGMMAAWFRIKYPHLVDGVIAASAPIWSFFGLSPSYDPSGFYQVVTRDASKGGGAAPACAANAKEAFRRIDKAGQTQQGRGLLASSFRTCAPLSDAGAAAALSDWAQSPWATLAMGNFPYPSTYLMHGLSLLPAWPVRAACEPLRDAALATGDDGPLFEAMREAVAVYFNNTGQAACFFNQPAQDAVAEANDVAITDTCVGDWDWQWCTEMHQPFTQGTDKDMFYPLEAYNQSAAFAGCAAQWGVTPRPLWAATTWWGSDLSRASNIVFSNGLLDPWSAGGVTRNISVSRDVTAIILPNGAHHLDLMFSNDLDPPDAVWARQYELARIQKWIGAKRGVAAM